MKAIIIDDELTAIQVLADKLSKYEDLMILGTATSGSKGIALLKECCPDVVFLDVELPDMSGLDFLEQMKITNNNKSKIVMYTGHESYMLDSFRNNAFDFLLKPVDDEEVKKVMQRLYISLNNRSDKMEKAGITRRNDEKLLFYTNSIDFRLVQLRDIGVFQYNHDMRAWEVVVAGREYPIRLKRNANNDVLVNIDPCFIQVSQRYIININYLLEVNDNICRFYPPFDKIDYVKVGRFFRRKLIERFNTL